MPRFAAITSFLGQTKDRFHIYNEPRDLEQKLALASEIEGCSGVEIVYPYEASNATETKRLLERYGLEIAALNVNVKGEPEFVNGGLTSADPKVREKAVGFIKSAKDLAIELGAPHVTCCPLGDGSEFPFQDDYVAAWRRLCNSFEEGGSYRSDEMPLFIEYKPKETRRITFLPRAADVLHLLNIIQVPTMGITLDYGHSIYAGENPSMALCMIAESGYDYYVHINDNDKSWDWDYFCGSHTFLEYVEFIYYLKRFKYDKHLTSDTQPTRWDIREMFALNNRITTRIWDLIDKIGAEEFEDVIQCSDYMRTWRFIEEKILRLT